MRQVETVDEGGQSSLVYLSPAVGAAKMIANMRSSIARGLPEATICKPHRMSMSIAGGGPSLADTHQNLEGWVCAVNGSLQWLVDQGLREGTSYACGCCDAGAHITEAVPAIPGVRYYIASVCDPSLFDKLVGAGCDVRLWHVTPNSTEDADGVEDVLNTEYDEWAAIGGGCTMGLRWVDLGYFLGFRKFHLHGMDSCFRGDSTHAYPDRADSKNWIEFNGRQTRHNFLAQVYDFSELLERLWTQDTNIELEVYGDGLLQDEWKAFRTANPLAFRQHSSRVRAKGILSRLSKDRDVIGVEVGVFLGRLSRELLEKRHNLRLFMVDPWEGNGASYIPGAPDWNAHISQDDQDEYKKIAILNTEFAADRRAVMVMRSLDAAAKFEQAAFDFVFIDGDHSYEAVKADIAAWWPLVASEGWLCGHDYDDPEFPGVKRAVDEFTSARGLALELDKNFTWFARKPC